MTSSSEPTRNSAIKIAIVVIPALLILSICIALYLGANAEQEEERPIVGEVTVPEMTDYLRKMQSLIGERDLQSEAGQKALRQLAATTMGSLGPENLGYEILKTQKDAAQGLLWPTIWVNAGDRESTSPVVLAIPQDGSGTGVAFAYGFAEYLTSHQTKVGVRIVFYPPLHDEDLPAWVWERCSEKGEKLTAFVKVAGGGNEVDLAELKSPAEDQSLLKELTEQKGWDGNVKIREGDAPFWEVMLAERHRGSRSEQAQRLIRMMPLVKDLVEQLAE